MLFADGTLATDRIYLTDADRNFRAITSRGPGRHQPAESFFHSDTHSRDQPSRKRHLLFECRLHHYTSGLAFAKSRYAFPTLGSLIGVRAEAYARFAGCLSAPLERTSIFSTNSPKSGTSCRSEAKRSGSLIDNLIGFRLAPVLRCTRLSAICKRTRWPTFYAPASFQTLGLLLSALNQITLPEQLGELQDPAIKHYIESTQLVGQLSNLKQSTPSHTQFQRAVDAWFDGFRQLKFIHFLRDHWHPQVPLNQVLEAPWFHTPTAHRW